MKHTIFFATIFVLFGWIDSANCQTEEKNIVLCSNGRIRIALEKESTAKFFLIKEGLAENKRLIFQTLNSPGTNYSCLCDDSTVVLLINGFNEGLLYKIEFNHDPAHLLTVPIFLPEKNRFMGFIPPNEKLIAISDYHLDSMDSISFFEFHVETNDLSRPILEKSKKYQLSSKINFSKGELQTPIKTEVPYEK